MDLYSNLAVIAVIFCQIDSVVPWLGNATGVIAVTATAPGLAPSSVTMQVVQHPVALYPSLKGSVSELLSISVQRSVFAPPRDCGELLYYSKMLFSSLFQP